MTVPGPFSLVIAIAAFLPFGPYQHTRLCGMAKATAAAHPSPPLGEREGPDAKWWEGEVGLSASALESPTSHQPSPPPRAERESRVLHALYSHAAGACNRNRFRL